MSQVRRRTSGSNTLKDTTGHHTLNIMALCDLQLGRGRGHGEEGALASLAPVRAVGNQVLIRTALVATVGLAVLANGVLVWLTSSCCSVLRGDCRAYAWRIVGVLLVYCLHIVGLLLVAYGFVCWLFVGLLLDYR